MKTHEKKWEDKGGCLFLVEMVFMGDTFKMKDLIGFSFKNHLLINKDGAMSYYANKKTIKKAKEFGRKKYSDLAFIEYYEQKISETEKGLKKIVNRVKKENLTKKDNCALFSLCNDFFEKYSELVGLYRFSGPDFYENIIIDIIKKFPEPSEESFNLFLSHKKDFNVDEKIKKQALKLNEIGKIRLDMHKVWQDTFNDFEKMFREISSRTDLSVLEIKNCLFSEIKEILLNDKKPDLNEIKKRIKFYNFVYQDTKFEINFNRDLIEKIELDLKEVKGKVAYPGKIKGNVKVILNSISKRTAQENKEIKEGVILVTGNTSPDLVPIIKKVSAIVTDEGGLLSHAATISREFKKPCVIGTKIATKIFKDGDYIEVDANKGIVRKIR